MGLSVLYWTRTVEYGEQGRLAHVGASVLGILLVAGWQAWMPRRAQPILHLSIAGFMLSLSLLLIPFLHNNFGLPEALDDVPNPDRPIGARFAGGMELIGVDFPNGATLEVDKPLNLILYWTAQEPIAKDYTLFLHLADAEDRLLYQFDGVPLQGRHPTRQWVPGQVFANPLAITVDAPIESGMATLSMGFYPINDRAQRQQVYDAAGNPVGDRLALATVRVTDKPPAPLTGDERSLLARWENGIGLEAADLPKDEQGAPIGVTLRWRVDAPIQHELTSLCPGTR